jgi:hypothetical protein
MRMRTWALAGLCAMWVVSWPMLLLESTRGLPGLLDMSRDRGAYDLVAIVYRGPDGVLGLSLFLAALLAFRTLLGLAQWLDRDRRVLAAWHWALRVHSVRWSLAFGLLWGMVAWMAPQPWRDALEAVALGVLLLYIFAVFVCGRPQTLLQAQGVGGWRPWWPGWHAVLIVLMLSLLSDVVNALYALAAAPIGPAIRAVFWITSIPLGVAIALISAAVWFGYRHPVALTAALRTLVRRDFLRSYLAGYAYMSIAAGLALAPVMVLTVVRVYIGPQYEDMAHTVGIRLPVALQVFISTGHHFDGGVGQCLLLPLLLSILFAEQRLIFVEGLRGILGPDAPAR